MGGQSKFNNRKKLISWASFLVFNLRCISVMHLLRKRNGDFIFTTLQVKNCCYGNPKFPCAQNDFRLPHTLLINAYTRSPLRNSHAWPARCAWMAWWAAINPWLHYLWYEPLSAIETICSSTSILHWPSIRKICALLMTMCMDGMMGCNQSVIPLSLVWAT